jgi:hypothetical protein
MHADVQARLESVRRTILGTGIVDVQSSPVPRRTKPGSTIVASGWLAVTRAHEHEPDRAQRGSAISSDGDHTSDSDELVTLATPPPVPGPTLPLPPTRRNTTALSQVPLQY